MIISKEISIQNFQAWGGARDTLDRVTKEGKCEELETVIEELLGTNGEAIDETKVNDLLWFDSEVIFNMLGIEEE